MGGRAATIEKLDRFFATQPKSGKVTTGNNDEGGVIGPGQIGQYWHGNEPSHHIAYFYTLLGAPDKCADIVSDICRTAYRPQPDGLCGNDDCGQMSAWYLFSMMGFYPFNPCGGEYVLGAPQVPKVTLKVRGPSRALSSASTPNFDSCTSFTITAKNLSKENKYVKSVTLNGKPITDWKISHEDVVKGGELVFEMWSGKGR